MYPASSTPSISRKARSSRRTICCSSSTSGPTRSPSIRPRPISTRAQAKLEIATLDFAARRRRWCATRPSPSGSSTRESPPQRDAAGQVASAEAALKQAELNLEWTEVRAPIAGRISDKRVDAGNLITGGQTGATLLTVIVSIDPIHFVFDGSEADFIHYLRLAAAGARPSSRDAQNPVSVRLADETEFKHSGRMDFVDNVVNPKTGTIRGRAIFENKDGLLTPGFFGRLRLFGGEQRGVADARYRHRVGSGQQGRVHGRR